MSPLTPQTKKTVLITGCSPNSIGSALALEFHHRSYHVIATARSLTRLQHLSALGVQCAELDVTSAASIHSLRDTLDLATLDILVNNAGGLFMSPISDASIEEWRSMFELNFFSVVQVTQTFLPALIKAKGIILNHSSQNAFFNFVAVAPYGVSKAAVEHYSNTLRNELQPLGVRVVTLVTGVVKSNITMGQMLDRPTVIAPSSLYFPVKKELEEALTGVGVRGKEMDADLFARKAVGDLLGENSWSGWLVGGGETPKWIWRGGTASVMYLMWLMGCFWKGLWDGVARRACGMHLLRERREEMERKKGV